MEQNGIWIEKFVMAAFMVDTHQQASLVTIGNLLQEVAGNHAHFHQMGYHDMQAYGQFWVLNRLRIEMNLFPKWRESLQIQTWVHNFKGPFSYRNFLLTNKDGQTLGSASTLWALIDAGTRRPKRIGTNSFPILSAKQSPCGLPGKVKEVVGKEAFGHKVNYFDLDMIGHVNNVKYIEWVINHLISTKPNSQFNKVEINFLAESHLNDEVTGIMDNNGEGYAFSLFNREKELEVCRMYISPQ